MGRIPSLSRCGCEGEQNEGEPLDEVGQPLCLFGQFFCSAIHASYHYLMSIRLDRCEGKDNSRLDFD